MAHPTTSSTFPSLRATMGDWVYYSTLMSFGEVARWISQTDQIHSNEHLRDWIQRELQSNRVNEISKYLLSQPQHFFNAIIVGIHEGSPEWYPLTVGDSPHLGNPLLSDEAKGAMGLLRLQGGEKVFAIDGQHRVKGIIRAIEEDPSLGKEMLCVLFVAHHSTPDGKQRTRRLFSTVNRNAKPVSKGEIIALDEDDAFAVVTRRLLEEYDGLRQHRVAFQRNSNLGPKNKTAITSILGLYELVQIIYSKAVGASQKSLRSFTAYRPSDEKIEEIYQQQVSFWQAMAAHIRPIREVLAAPEEACAATSYRTTNGGNLLFRPAGQKAFARASRVLVNRGVALDNAISRLATVPLELGAEPWDGVLWNSATKTMITKHVVLAQNIFLHYIGELPEPKEFPVATSYATVTGMTLTAKSRRSNHSS